MTKDLTYKQSAKLLGITVDSIYMAVHRGRLHPYRKEGNKTLYLDEDEVVEYGKLNGRSFVITDSEADNKSGKYIAHKVDVEALEKQILENVTKEFFRRLSQSPLPVG